MKKKLTCLLVGLLLFQQAIAQENVPSIYGGQSVANMSDAPWVVKIERNGSAWCTGVLISNQYVLTAAHCVTCNRDCQPPYDSKTPFNPASYKIYYGSRVVNSSNKSSIPSSNVQAIYVHGLYDGYAGKIKKTV